MIRILLVDDQNLVQQGIKSLLDQDSDLKVIGTVKDGRSAVNQIDLLRPDIVLLDIEMPGMDGITATKYISHLSPNTKVIILSSHEDKKYLTRALMAGAKAYILKDSLMKDLKQAILAVNGGYSHIESRLLAKIFDPNNLKLDGSKSEPETNKVNHQSQKPPSQKPPSQKPPNQKPQSHSVHRTQNTPVNLQ
ncbi:MAG: response regulator transcription factor, partial [Waterburya sp.]